MTTIRQRVSAQTDPIGSATHALTVNGFTGERLQKLAHKVANDELHKRGAVLKDRYEDLVSSLVEVGCRYAPRYDRALATSTFEAYIAKKMAHRIDDFFRAKSQGFGDRRYGNDNRVDLVDDPDPADHDVDFDAIINDRMRARWQRAADAKQCTLADLIVVATDQYARMILSRNLAA